MCTCHTNHSMGCIKERIKLPVRKQDGIYINLEMCQITVVCSVKHFMAIRSAWCRSISSALSTSPRPVGRVKE